MDLDTGETIGIVVDHGQSMCTLITQPLTARRHYNFTIYTSNSAGSAISTTIISKHM